MVEILKESGGQDVVVVPETGGSRSSTPTDYTVMVQTIPEESAKDLTPLQQFYSGQSIFVTGGTGFLGKLMIEKLLRACPDIACIYLLVRPKKGKDMHQRLEELLEDPLFSKLKEERPKFRHQIVAISGDCGLPELGLSPSDRGILIREVSIVFHVAATVNFREKMKAAVAINVQGSKNALNLCKEMTQLKSYIHVSTAYSNCDPQLKNIEEKFYDPPIEGNKLISIVENMDDKLADNITKSLVGKLPNTYVFTKAVAEDVVRKEGAGLPIGIYRPAILISTYQEPIRGWIDNVFGPIWVVRGMITGLLRSIHCDGSFKANMVPGDMAANALIASAWDVANAKKNNKNNNTMPIYNHVLKDNSITFDDFMNMTAKHGQNLPTTQAVWYNYGYRNTKHKFVHLLYIYLLHFLPALIVDTVAVCIGKKPWMLKMCKKVHELLPILNYFTTNEWSFTNDNVLELLDKLDNKDRGMFSMDVRDIDWDTYFQNYMRGIRTYIIKDPIETLPQARVKWQRLYWIHQALKVLLAYVFLRLCWFVLLAVYSMVS